MSKRRELVRAQQALNAAVAHHIEVERVFDETTLVGRNEPSRLALYAAYDEWERVRSDLEGAGVEGKRDTSLAASLPNQGTLRRLVLDMVVSNFIQYHCGMTTDTIEARLRRPHQSISARVHELERAGLLVDSTARAQTRSGHKAIVYVPSNRAMELVRGQHAKEAT